MAPFKSFSLRGAFRASILVSGLAGSVVVVAQERALSSQNYVVAVPVVSARAIEVTRIVERPEKTCSPVRQSHYRDTRSADYSRSDSRRESAYEYRRDRRGGVGSQLLGGLIGGVIGNQFGGGNGKKALTVAGALLGSSIASSGSRRERYRGDDARYYSRHRDARDWDEREYRSEYQPEYQCRTTTSTREVIEVTGYDVTYSYNNTLYKRRMDYDPGDTLELHVRAEPDVAPIVADS